MPRPDWKKAEDYEALEALDTPGLAAEFLKRNPDYIADHERLARLAAEGRLDPADRDAFAAAWGVRFRHGWRTPELDGASSAHRHRRRADTSGVSRAPTTR